MNNIVPSSTQKCDFTFFTINFICTGDGEQKEQLQDVEDQDVS